MTDNATSHETPGQTMGQTPDEKPGQTAGQMPNAAPEKVRTANVVSNFLFGIKVLGGQVSWLLIRLLRACELRQLQRRLDAECAILGRWAADALDSDVRRPALSNALFDIDITRKQIRFLRDEIAFLEQEREQSRAVHMARQRESLGL